MRQRKTTEDKVGWGQKRVDVASSLLGGSSGGQERTLDCVAIPISSIDQVGDNPQRSLSETPALELLGLPALSAVLPNLPEPTGGHGLTYGCGWVAVVQLPYRDNDTGSQLVPAGLRPTLACAKSGLSRLTGALRRRRAVRTGKTPSPSPGRTGCEDSSSWTPTTTASRFTAHVQQPLGPRTACGVARSRDLARADRALKVELLT